ncbi:MAG: peptidase S1 [Sandaracinus sp.]|nr:peptidase S1 [Sandaracinus sp.]
MPGTYKLWVGSYSRGQSIPYTLGVSELGSVMPSSLAGGAGAAAAAGGGGALDVTGGDANFGAVTLAPGFVPDPSVHNGTSGGSVSASSVNPSCTGYVSARPDHLFNASGAFANLRILVNSSADTTLVVRRPDGTFVCNDDSDGTNPMVAGNFPPGQYRIWVGSYQQGTNSPYKIGFTELASVTSAQLQ